MIQPQPTHSFRAKQASISLCQLQHHYPLARLAAQIRVAARQTQARPPFFVLVADHSPASWEGYSLPNPDLCLNLILVHSQFAAPSGEVPRSEGDASWWLVPVHRIQAWDKIDDHAKQVAFGPLSGSRPSWPSSHTWSINSKPRGHPQAWAWLGGTNHIHFGGDKYRYASSTSAARMACASSATLEELSHASFGYTPF